jgi:cytochrome P450
MEGALEVAILVAVALPFVRLLACRPGRDPSVFDSPAEFDPDRWRTARPTHDAYSPFGSTNSRSRCLGEGFTLTVGKLFVAELLRGYEIEVTHAAPVEFSGVHWRPSKRFSLHLRPRPKLSAV